MPIPPNKSKSLCWRISFLSFIFVKKRFFFGNWYFHKECQLAIPMVSHKKWAWVAELKFIIGNAWEKYEKKYEEKYGDAWEKNEEIWKKGWWKDLEFWNGAPWVKELNLLPGKSMAVKVSEFLPYCGQCMCRYHWKASMGLRAIEQQKRNSRGYGPLKNLR